MGVILLLGTGPNKKVKKTTTGTTVRLRGYGGKGLSAERVSLSKFPPSNKKEKYEIQG
jgi:hypothetical protein